MKKTEGIEQLMMQQKSGFFQAHFNFKQNFGFLVLAGMVSLQAHAANPDKTFVFSLLGEPPQLNSMKSTDTESGSILGHINEGLVAVGKDGKDEPAVATEWKLDDKGVVFKLRKNAKWSDGKPVRAQDFIFAWKTALEPKMASEYAFMLYAIKNAEDINKGKLPASELGAQAVDDYTIKITFAYPCAYFPSMTAMPVFYPVREDFYQIHKDKYASSAETMLSNGAFTLTKWVHGAELQMDKNPNYWNASAIDLERISIPFITPDNTARYNLFKDKKIDLYDRISRDDLPKAQKDKFKVQSFSDGGIWYLEFNFREGRLTRNLNLRKAMKLVFQPDGEYVNSVLGIPGTIPGRGFIPIWVRGVKDKFRKEYPIGPSKTNLVEAKKHLALAMKELGLSKPPSLTLLTQDTNLSKREAEYFQSLFKKTLGIDIRIDNQIFKQRLAKMSSGDFDLVVAGWGPDYADPMTFADLKASWNENNRGRWKNDEYDKLIRTAMSTTQQSKRIPAMAAAEKIMLDDVALIMTYERVVAYLAHPWVNGVTRRAVGFDPDFRKVKLSKRN